MKKESVTLPREILWKIFGYIVEKSAYGLTHIRALAQVCHDWREAAKTFPLWREYLEARYICQVLEEGQNVYDLVVGRYTQGVDAKKMYEAIHRSSESTLPGVWQDLLSSPLFYGHEWILMMLIAKSHDNFYQLPMRAQIGLLHRQPGVFTGIKPDKLKKEYVLARMFPNLWNKWDHDVCIERIEAFANDRDVVKLWLLTVLPEDLEGIKKVSDEILDDLDFMAEVIISRPIVMQQYAVARAASVDFSQSKAFIEKIVRGSKGAVCSYFPKKLSEQCLEEILVGVDDRIALCIREAYQKDLIPIRKRESVLERNGNIGPLEMFGL